MGTDTDEWDEPERLSSTPLPSPLTTNGTMTPMAHGSGAAEEGEWDRVTPMRSDGSDTPLTGTFRTVFGVGTLRVIAQCSILISTMWC